VRNPRERFIDLANKRVTAAILQLRLVGNLANRKNYEYDADDAKKIIRTLQAEMNALKARFQGQDGDNGAVFTL
jgi:ABC-type Fe3+-hydroxamate transport system substrate-binding protein